MATGGSRCDPRRYDTLLFHDAEPKMRDPWGVDHPRARRRGLTRAQAGLAVGELTLKCQIGSLGKPWSDDSLTTTGVNDGERQRPEYLAFKLGNAEIG